jgi:NADH-quinone oxidoreductase subunit L
LAGFFSKDAILDAAWHHGGALAAIGMLIAAASAFYIVRMLCLTFYGKSRLDHHTREHLHETSVVMWGPLTVLAVLSISVGYLGVPALVSIPGIEPHILADYLAPVFFIHRQAEAAWAFASGHHSHFWETLLMGCSVGLVFVGSGIALLSYALARKPNLGPWAAPFGGLHALLSNKYWVDELYARYIYAPLRDIAEFLWRIFDIKIINGLLNGLGYVMMGISGFTSFKMTGSIHRHGILMIAGMLVLLFWLL